MLKIKIDGIAETTKYLNSKKKNVEKGISDGIIQGGEILATEVRASIQGQRAEHRSVDTGEFLASVQVGTSKANVVVFSDVPQSAYMEYGTTTISPRRHFNNSADRKKQQIVKAVEGSIKKDL